MDDVLDLRRGPLGDRTLDARGPDLSIRDEPFRTLLDVRGTAAAPPGPVGSHVWQLGPDWWLVDDGPVAAAVLEAPQVAELRSSLADGVSVVDVSSHRTVFELSGADALEVMSHGCSIDLERVDVGACVQGALAHVQIAMARVDPVTWRLYPRASFARHLAAWLVDAAVEHLDTADELPPL